MTTCHTISSVRTLLGECPVWDQKTQRLFVLDSRLGFIYCIEKDQLTHSIAIPSPAGSFSINEDGRLLIALKEHLVLLHIEQAFFTVVDRINESDIHIRLNDGVATKEGDFIVGTMHTHRTDSSPAQGGIYRLSSKGELEKIATPLGVTNGPCFNPINQRLYICDSADKNIYSYHYEPNAPLSDKQLFTNTRFLLSAPDGCAFDDQGGLWTALVHQGAVVRLDQQGVVTHRFDLPVKHPTALCFGGPSLRDLYITSIKDSGRLQTQGPVDGAILCIKEVGFTGAVTYQTRLSRFIPHRPIC